jgi:hypothetical protein
MSGVFVPEDDAAAASPLGFAELELAGSSDPPDIRLLDCCAAARPGATSRAPSIAQVTKVAIENLNCFGMNDPVMARST